MLENFEQLQLLGRGFHGSVFLVRQRQTQKLYALKILLESCTIQRQLMKTLSHPNILRIYSFQEENHNQKLLLEYMEGGDLRKYINAGFELEENLVVSMLAQMTLALHYLHHENAIIHRDIKVENVLIGSNGLIKLADFGISKRLKKEESFTMSQVGTPFTLSPQRISQKQYDYKSDIWGLGCVLYELMAKRKPFLTKESNLLELYNQIVKQSPDPLPSRYSPELRNLVLSLLEKKPENRPTSLEILENKEVRKQLLRLRDKYPEYKECRYMTQSLDNAPTSKFNQREEINLPFSSIPRSLTESMKTTKSKSSMSQLKIIPAFGANINRGLKKPGNLIEDRFYFSSLMYFVEEAKQIKKRKEMEAGQQIARQKGKQQEKLRHKQKQKIRERQYTLN